MDSADIITFGILLLITGLVSGLLIGVGRKRTVQERQGVPSHPPDPEPSAPLSTTSSSASTAAASSAPPPAPARDYKLPNISAEPKNPRPVAPVDKKTDRAPDDFRLEDEVF